MTQGLRAYDADLGTEPLGELWRLEHAGRALRCVLTTHTLGWELKVWAGEEFSRSQVCKTQDDVFDVSAAWRAEAIAKGWTA